MYITRSFDKSKEEYKNTIFWEPRNSLSDSAAALCVPDLYSLLHLERNSCFCDKKEGYNLFSPPRRAICNKGRENTPSRLSCGSASKRSWRFSHLFTTLSTSPHATPTSKPGRKKSSSQKAPPRDYSNGFLTWGRPLPFWSQETP